MEAPEIQNPEVERIRRLIDEYQIEEAIDGVIRLDIYSTFKGEVHELEDFFKFIEISNKDTNLEVGEKQRLQYDLKLKLVKLLYKVVSYYDFYKASTFLNEGRYQELFPFMQTFGRDELWLEELNDLEAAYNEFDRQHQNGAIDLKRFVKLTQPIKGSLKNIIEQNMANLQGPTEKTAQNKEPIVIEGDFEQKFQGEQLKANPLFENETQSKIETQTTYIPRYQSDGATGKDQLGILHEVDAFMQLIISKNLQPPLSIGLLGNWGSGKSFFMNKLIERIDLKTKSLLEKEEVQDDYCTNIAQIKFNAWYYVDANLWASIVNKIFQSLGKYVGLQSEAEKKESDLYKQLASTTELKEIAQQSINEIEIKQETLENQLGELRKQKEEKRRKLEGIRAKDVFKELLQDDKVKSFVEEAREKLEFEDKRGIKDTVVESLNDVDGLINEYKSNKIKVKESIKFIVSRKQLKTLSILLLFILLPILVVYVLFPLLENWNTVVKGYDTQTLLKVLTGIGSLVTATSLFIKKIITASEPVFKKINEGVDYLNLAKKRLENIENLATASIDQEIESVKHEIASIENEQDLLEQRRIDAEIELDAIQKEIEAIEQGKRFSSFLEQRITSEDYKKHLGIISLIREDFSKLTEYFQSNIVKISDDLKVDRIVLYIDDLDRCPPKKVVEVLQAIHLILAFPLFVVVVGVDVRWIYKSLMAEYGDMLHHVNIEGDENKTRISSSATPFDYLEKVFQIPFQIKPIDNDGKKSYISKLLRDDVINDVVKGEYFPPSIEVEEVLKNIIDENRNKAREEAGLPADTSINIETEEEVLYEIAQLKIYNHQYKFIQYLAPIIGDSPRSIKRFINVARLVKSNPTWIPAYKKNPEIEFPSFLTLMAIIIGTPILSNFFLECLNNDSSSKNLTDLVLNNQPVENTDYESKLLKQQWQLLGQFVKNNDNKAMNKIIQSIDIDYLRQIQPTVSRFSFRTLI